MEEESDGGVSAFEPQAAQPPESADLPGSLARLNHEDAQRLTKFVEQDSDRVRHLIESLCGPQIDLDGIVSEATARAVEQLLRGRVIHQLPAWIARTALNLGRSELRHQAVRRRRSAAIAAGNAGPDAIDDAAARLDLRRALAELPRRQAEVIALYYGLDLPVAEIARTIGRSEGAVKASLFKARATLATALGASGGENHGTA
jgi:RNA polymerase sigma-70 factor (ECF subfamily)